MNVSLQQHYHDHYDSGLVDMMLLGIQMCVCLFVHQSVLYNLTITIFSAYWSIKSFHHQTDKCQHHSFPGNFCECLMRTPEILMSQVMEDLLLKNLVLHQPLILSGNDWLFPKKCCLCQLFLFFGRHLSIRQWQFDGFVWLSKTQTIILSLHGHWCLWDASDPFD